MNKRLPSSRMSGRENPLRATTASMFRDRSKNPPVMESTSDSDSSIQSATSRALSNISKKDKTINFPESSVDLLERQTTRNNKNANFWDDVISDGLVERQPLQKCPSLKDSIPPWNNTNDGEFTNTKNLLFKLGDMEANPDSKFMEKSSLPVNNSIVNKSPLYSNLEAIQKTLINYARRNNIYVHSYDFVSLLTTILLLCGKALHCVLHINIALLPLYEIFIHVVRYILDQLIQIREIRSRRDKFQASVVFAGQILAVLLVTTFIYGSVLFPILFIGMSIFWKIGYFLLV